MPYIKELDRLKFEMLLDETLERIKNPGELNYVISFLCKNYKPQTKWDYKKYNEVLGVMECSKQEFYRRFVTPYENLKLTQNGDIE